MRQHEQAEIRIVVDRGPDGAVRAVYCNRPEAVVIYTGKKGEPTIGECGGCGAYHLATFAGDCRSDADRFEEC